MSRSLSKISLAQERLETKSIVMYLSVGLRSNLLQTTASLLSWSCSKLSSMSGIQDDTGGIDHTRTEEPGDGEQGYQRLNDYRYHSWKSSPPESRCMSSRKHDVTGRHTVVVTTDLLLVLVLRVDENLRNQNGHDIFEQLDSEVQLRPVMTLLHNVKNVTWDTSEFGRRPRHRNRTIKINFSVEVGIMEKLHRYLFLSLVNLLQLRVLDGDVFLDVLSWKDNLLIPP
jgi:hypothetical protein